MTAQTEQQQRDEVLAIIKELHDQCDRIEKRIERLEAKVAAKAKAAS